MLDLAPPKVSSSSLTPNKVKDLVAEEKLLRILRPDLQTQLQQAVEKCTEAKQYVVEHDGHLYISCLQIEDPQHRKHVYHLLQRYQLGERVDLTELPPELQQLLQPRLTRFGRFLGAALIGGTVGIMSGILAMSVAMLLVSSGDWISNQSMLGFAGMGFTAVTFIIFCILGWAAGTFVAWHRHLPWQGEDN